jgi:transcriptional regulator with XRE-family HTH domain
MDISQRIAHNLSAWMAATRGRETLMQVAKASGVGFGTVQRARNGEGNLTVQNLEMIAAAFRRQAVELLADPEISGDAAATASAAVLVVHERRGDYLTDDEQLLLEALRVADDGARRSLLLLARDALERFGHRRTNHQQ